MNHGQLFGHVTVNKPKQLSVSLLSGYKDGIYTCSYAFSNGAWGMEYSDFKKYALKGSYEFSELWGLYRLCYFITRVELKGRITVHIKSDQILKKMRKIFDGDGFEYTWTTNDAGHAFIDIMAKLILINKKKLELTMSYTPLHRCTHELRLLTRDLASKSMSKAKVTEEANQWVTRFLT